VLWRCINDTEVEKVMDMHSSNLGMENQDEPLRAHRHTQQLAI